MGGSGEPLNPRVGDILAIRLSQDDAADLIPWLESKALHKGEWSGFLRQILRQRIALEQNPVGAINREEMADLISNLVRDALRGASVTLPSSAETTTTVESTEQAINQNVVHRLRALGGDEEDDDE